MNKFIVLTLWHHSLLTYGYSYCRKRHSARMSKITNDCLTRSDTGCFIAVPIWHWQWWASNGYSGVVTMSFDACRVVSNRLIWSDYLNLMFMLFTCHLECLPDEFWSIGYCIVVNVNRRSWRLRSVAEVLGTILVEYLTDLLLKLVYHLSMLTISAQYLRSITCARVLEWAQCLEASSWS